MGTDQLNTLISETLLKENPGAAAFVNTSAALPAELSCVNSTVPDGGPITMAAALPVVTRKHPCRLHIRDCYILSIATV
jgi:hypothetical protein